jgi:hypothetical protein
VEIRYQIVYQAILATESASAVEQTRHTLLLLRMELHIQNGIAILSRKIVCYAEDVIDTSSIKRSYLQFMFVEVFVKKELQIEFVINAGGKQILKAARRLIMSITYGTDILKYRTNGYVASVMQNCSSNPNANSRPKKNVINTLASYLEELEIQCMEIIRLT